MVTVFWDPGEGDISQNVEQASCLLPQFRSGGSVNCHISQDRENIVELRKYR